MLKSSYALNEYAIDKAIVEAEQVGEELVTAEQTFIQKYGQATAHGVEIVLLLVIVGKLLGAM